MFKFHKYLTITCIFGALYGVVEYNFQFFSDMAFRDPLMICYALWALALFSVFEGCRVALFDSVSSDQLELVAFIATSLGLLGTFMGLSFAFEAMALGTLDVQNLEIIKKTMSDLSAYMSLAMNTTITGLLVALPCYVYCYFLGDSNEDA